jgi:hypothetical protein
MGKSAGAVTETGEITAVVSERASERIFLGM